MNDLKLYINAISERQEFSVRPCKFEFILVVLVTTSFYGVELLAPCPTPNLEDQGFSVRVLLPLATVPVI